MAFVRVTAVVDNFPLFLLPATGYSGTTATIKAQAVGGRVLAGTAANPLKTIFPYSPIANVDGTTAATTGDPFGFTVGGMYDLKWPANAVLGTLGANKVPCSGDNNQAMLNRTTKQEWGEIFESASTIRQSVLDDSGGINLYVGEVVPAGSGQKNTIAGDFATRAAQDTNDSTACNLTDDPATCMAQFDAYLGSNHNGRRLVTVVVNNGDADSTGTAYPAGSQHVALGFAQFWLFPSYPTNGGSNNPWCGVYVGDAPALDTPNGGGIGGVNGKGVGTLRLIR